MRGLAHASLLCVAIAALSTGCAQNPYVMQGQVQSLQTQLVSQAQRSREQESRLSSLDRDNQELQTLLAQSQQQSRIDRDQVAALQEQLRSASTQLAQLKTENRTIEEKADTLAATTRKRIGATITANSSLRDTLPVISIPGVNVRQDGDVVRVELPASRLFEPGTSRIASGALPMIDAVAAELLRSYPQQMIGVEGHTDSDPARGTAATSHALTSAQAMAVLELLVSRDHMPPTQLYAAGHGGNHPLVSNATPAGRERNRRIELVVYPERMARR